MSKDLSDHRSGLHHRKTVKQASDARIQKMLKKKSLKKQKNLGIKNPSTFALG